MTAPGDTPAACQPPAGPCRSGFLFFLLANVVVFLRPAELFPALSRFHLYEVLIVASLICSLPRVFCQLKPAALRDHPITLCVALLLATVALSQLSHLRLHAAIASSAMFAKLLLYYLLLVATVDRPARLRAFLWSTGAAIVVMVALSVAQYRGMVHFAALQSPADEIPTWELGIPEVITRMYGPGIFNDPNDLCLLIVMAIPFAFAAIVGQRAVWRKLALTPVALFLFYAVMLTGSRGGFIALMAGMLALLAAEFGWKRSLLLALIALPLLLIVFHGRQTQLQMGRTTARQRIDIWAHGFPLFFHSPIFGAGEGQYVKTAGYVAHNSFLHSYAELGFVGGTLFFAAMVLSLLFLWRIPADEDRSGMRLRSCFVSATAAACAGMMTLSRQYELPTYTLLGLVTVYLNLAPGPRPWLTRRLIAWVAAGSVAFILLLWLFVQFQLHRHGHSA